MKRGSRILAWAILLAMLAAVLWLALPTAWAGSIGRRWVWLVIVLVLGLWLLACSRVKIWLARGPDTPARARVLGLLALAPVRVCLALLAFPALVGWMIGFTGLLGRPQGSLLVAVIDNLFMGLMWTGMAFIGLAFVRRGEEPRCRKCQYDLAGAPEGGYALCPECGASLRLSTAIIKGTRHVIVPMVVVGVLLVIISIGSIGLVSRGSAAYMPYLPTGSLIKEVTAAPRGFTHVEWTELLTRTLTQQETEQLFEGVLELRERKGFTSSEAEGWMDRAALASSVPAEMIERYYEGMLGLWIAAPDGVQRGQPRMFRFGFGGDFRGNIHVPTSSVLQVWFVPDELIAGGRAANMVHDPSGPIYGIQMNTSDRSFRGVKRDPENPAPDGPVANVDVAQVAGDTIELRGTGWLFIAPHGTPAPPLGSSIPVGAVWSKRVDLRKTVRIGP